VPGEVSGVDREHAHTWGVRSGCRGPADTAGPYRLELTGPAGGRWSFGTGGEEMVMDAADFCRVISGRRVPTAGHGNRLGRD
jgi:hypothetical protein